MCVELFSKISGRVRRQGDVDEKNMLGCCGKCGVGTKKSFEGCTMGSDDGLVCGLCVGLPILIFWVSNYAGLPL